LHLITSLQAQHKTHHDGASLRSSKTLRSNGLGDGAGHKGLVDGGEDVALTRVILCVEGKEGMD